MSGPNGRFDLNAARQRRAAQAESAGERWEFTFGDPPRVFSLAPQREWPGKSKRMLDEGDFADLLDILLGPDAAAFWDCDPSMGDLEDLFDEYGKWVGVGGVGESKASRPRASTPT